tara:strand:+ start:652 stop:963 length:312 start_codon:yes stop_codon:yes gene_type:complete
MRDFFVDTLKKAEIWDLFVNEYGEDWQALKDFKEGWFFGKDLIQCRICRLFDNHSDGYNWKFDDSKDIDFLIFVILKSHGFKVVHNGGDEEDGLLIMELINKK